MKKSIYISVIIIFASTILLIQTSSGKIDVEYCKDCHGKIDPIPSYNLTKNCLICHDTHGTREGCCQPKIRDPEKVHEVHARAGKKVPQQDDDCAQCHQSPVSCTSCHNSHDNVIVKDTKNSTICIDCHGKLPTPGGHEEFRKSLEENKHNWMNCGTCHISPYKDLNGIFRFELHFKDLSTMSVDNNIELCKICHSFQYERLNENSHGTPKNKCTDCHNPHTTKLSGPKDIITPKETPTNISTRMYSMKGWMIEKVPILNNPVVLAIIAIIMISMIAEHVLSKHEKDMKVAYDMVKIQAEDSVLKTLEVKLKNQNVNIINKILQDSGINILGMTMIKEEGRKKDKGYNEHIYKYVIFIDTGKSIIDENDEKKLIDNILSIDDVSSVEFTDKYEL